MNFLTIKNCCDYDVLGRETTNNQGLQLYDDGSVEKRYNRISFVQLFVQ